jgi:hypothetical protein
MSLSSLLFLFTFVIVIIKLIYELYINQLQIFLKVVKTQSVTKASEELHLTQPAVSIQLKNFLSGSI